MTADLNVTHDADRRAHAVATTRQRLEATIVTVACPVSRT